MTENKYSYNSPKYLSLITKLQERGYEWLVGAFHEYYLMPPGSLIGAPYGKNMWFIWADGIEDEVSEVMDEIYA